jgi:simple sugar transport system permease protein
MKATMMKNSRLINLGFQFLAVLLALGVTTLILLAAGAQPMEAYKNIIVGSVGSFDKFSDVLVAWIPLLITVAGLLITFSAGLWNIGVEGQIILGAISTTWVLRLLQDTAVPPALTIALGLLAGIIGGALWASLAGALKTFGGVNEIFGGLGLNFVATAVTIWLIFGPWKRPGVASIGGTESFGPQLWLPTLPESRLSLWALGLAILSIVIVYFLLQGTYFGLRLKAVGKNAKAAYLLGVPTWQYSMMAFMVCGAFAGLAGAIQVTAVYHRLIGSISSGYGFLGLLVAMLVNYQAIWAAPVALFFGALNIGGIQLPIILKLDSSITGILQGTLVLFVLMVEGVRQRIMKRAGDKQ